MNKPLPKVVIFGRTNVGKSSLFNRLIEERKAMVSSIAGTTRDSNSGTVRWQNAAFELIDTGGIINFDAKIFSDSKRSEKNIFKTSDPQNPLTGEDKINIKVQKQAANLLKEADAVLFLVDNKTGLLPQDRALANLIKKNIQDKNKIILVANKVDNFSNASEAAEFAKLGFGSPAVVSAATGMGTGDLLDLIVKFLKKEKKARKGREKKEDSLIDKERNIAVSLIGKPNVGKSSLLNKLLGYEKVIVSEVPHTTREPQDTEIIYNGKKITLIDTAGISKQGAKENGLTKYGIEKTLKTLSKSDIALLVIDINEDVTHQDSKLIEEIIERGKSFIIIANKWDLVPEKDTKKYTTYINRNFPYVLWAPIIFISALTGSKTQKIFDLILEMAEARRIQISDSGLNKFLLKLVKMQPPAKGKGIKRPRIHELTQTSSNPPKFRLRIGFEEDLHNSYVRFVKNKLREKYNITGTPIKIEVVKTQKVHGKHQIQEIKKIE